MILYCSLFLLYALIRTCHSFALPSIKHSLRPRDDKDPADLSWVKDFAAIGDSYAAGIGAGTVLNGNEGDEKCSRYDAAHSVIMHTSGFGKDPKFTFLACSGDTSKQVLEQVKELADDSQDLVTVSAGGNDALLSEVLKACVFLPGTQENCDAKLADTKKAIDNDLLSNIDDLLQELAPKVRQGGIVVYTLYAQFFNADTDACSEQTWNWFEDIVPGTSGIKLSKELRKQLNDLVVEANRKIQGAIAGQSGSTRPSNMNIAIVEWDQAVGESKGRFCEEGSADDPADPSNAGLMFQRLKIGNSFIPPTRKAVVAANDDVQAGQSDTGVAKKMDVIGANDEAQPDTATPKKVAVAGNVDGTPVGKVKAKAEGQALTKRVPDDIGRVFHPSILGQELIASFSMMAILTTRAKTSTGQSAACSRTQPSKPPPPKGTPLNPDNPGPKCDNKFVSGLPAKVFSLDNKVFGQFCEAVGKNANSKLEWIVDLDGNKVPRLNKRLLRRSPPADPNRYKDYRIILTWSGGENACGKGCEDAYRTMAAGQCGTAGGTQDIMACYAEAEANCGLGTFNYRIEPPKDRANTCDQKDDPGLPQPQQRVCTPYKKDEVDICGWSDIKDDKVNEIIDWWRGLPVGLIDVKSMNNYTQVLGRDENPTYMVNVGYIPGCNAFQEQTVENPQGNSGDPPEVSISYRDILKDLYKNCKDPVPDGEEGNWGMGGYQDYGCLRYGFYPTKIKGIFSDRTPKHYEYYWNAKNKWCGDDTPKNNYPLVPCLAPPCIAPIRPDRS